MTPAPHRHSEVNTCRRRFAKHAVPPELPFRRQCGDIGKAIRQGNRYDDVSEVRRGVMRAAAGCRWIGAVSK